MADEKQSEVPTSCFVVLFGFRKVEIKKKNKTKKQKQTKNKQKQKTKTKQQQQQKKKKKKKSWCGPCRVLAPIITESATKKNVKLVKVDCDVAVHTASKYQV